MKRFLFLLVLLLLVSLLSCGNNSDSVLGPDSDNQVQADQEQSAPSGAPQADVVLTDDGGDGDPWEDNGPEGGGGPGDPQKPPIIGPPEGGGGKDTLPEPDIEP
ncbi:MAG: hypothetical protein JSV52_05705 [Candidatus Zixiibacteriota bacterium]|nr:MAG: hypothetical protein JSV52_05705 [candidate division Zixibacteria bacterium]